MNIFVTSLCPIESAQSLNNKHSIKMPTESLGMLAFAFPEGEAPVLNSRSHRHYVHPASRWVRQSKPNFEWLLIHAIEQCDEYRRRYHREHKYQQHVEWVIDNYKFLQFPEKELTPFARCFSEFKELLDKTIPDTVEAYREFCKLDKIDFAKWPSIDKIPDWWIEKSEKFVDKSFKNGIYTKRPPLIA